MLMLPTPTSVVRTPAGNWWVTITVAHVILVPRLSCGGSGSYTIPVSPWRS